LLFCGLFCLLCYYAESYSSDISITRRNDIPYTGEFGHPSLVSTLTRYINKDCGFSFWRRSYNDKIICNEDESQRICQYI